jgi:hypothetical protein
MAVASLVLELVVALAGWGALAWLVTHAYPDRPAALVQFFGALFVAVAASVAILIWCALSALRRANPPRYPLVYLSHGVALSGLAVFGLWLQSLRLLSPLHAVLLMGLFVFFEVALALGSRIG